jgi:AcrR family transcriptional regulator
MATEDSDPAGPTNPASHRHRSRDRAATKRRILDACQSILVEQGPSGFGVNVLARQAGVDKQLIYRYFGGLDGLLEDLGERLAQWWQDRLLEGAPPEPPESYGHLMELLAVRLLHIMRDEPLAQQSALWGLLDSSGPVASLTAARSRALGAWIVRARGDLRPPEGVDAPAVNAMIISGISYFVLASRTADNVIGLDPKDEVTWTRLESAVRLLVKAAYQRS